MENDEGLSISSPADRMTSYFKLIKNTKAYNWEIKIYNDDLEVMKKQVLEMNEWAKDNFSASGGQE